MAWNNIFTDDFEDGNTTGWVAVGTGSNSFAISTPGLNGSSYKIRCKANNSADRYLYRTWTNKARVRVSVRVKPEDATNRSGYIFFNDSGATANPSANHAAFFRLIGGNITLICNTNAYTLCPYDTSTEYLIVTELNCDTDKVDSITINGTVYNNGGAGYAFGFTKTGIGMIAFDHYSPAGTTYANFDDVVVEELATVAVGTMTPHSSRKSIVTFDIDVVNAQAINAANWSANNGLQIVSVTQDDTNSKKYYVVHSAMTNGTTYAFTLDPSINGTVNNYTATTPTPLAFDLISIINRDSQHTDFFFNYEVATADLVSGKFSLPNGCTFASATKLADERVVRVKHSNLNNDTYTFGVSGIANNFKETLTDSASVVVSQQHITADGLTVNGVQNGRLLGPDWYGNIWLAFIEPSDATTSALTVKRSATSGGALSDVSSNCVVTGPTTIDGKRVWLIHDRRPNYLTPKIQLGETGYYKVNNGSVDSNEAGAVSQVDKDAISHLRSYRWLINDLYASKLNYQRMCDDDTTTQNPRSVYVYGVLLNGAYAYKLHQNPDFLWFISKEIDYLETRESSPMRLLLHEDTTLAYGTATSPDFTMRIIYMGYAAIKILENEGETTIPARMKTKFSQWITGLLALTADTGTTFAGSNSAYKTVSNQPYYGQYFRLSDWLCIDNTHGTNQLLTIAAALACVYTDPTSTHYGSSAVAAKIASHITLADAYIDPITGKQAQGNNETRLHHTMYGRFSLLICSIMMKILGEEDPNYSTLEAIVQNTLKWLDGEAPVWQANHAYSVNDIVNPTTGNAGHRYIVTSGGTSGNTEPTWPTTVDGTVTLDGVTYKELSSYTTEGVWTRGNAGTEGTRAYAPTYELGYDESAHNVISQLSPLLGIVATTAFNDPSNHKMNYVYAGDGATTGAYDYVNGDSGGYSMPPWEPVNYAYGITPPIVTTHDLTGTVQATSTKTHSLTGTVIPAPEIHNSGTFNGQELGSTKYAAVYLGAICANSAIADVHVYRSATNGGTYTEITSNCVITEPSADQFLIYDRRPAYGTPVIWPGNTAYYKIVINGIELYTSVDVSVNKSAIYATIADIFTPANTDPTWSGHYLFGGMSALANFFAPDSSLVLDELYQFNIIAPWEARLNSHAYSVGDIIYVLNNAYRCTTAGTSASSAPSFNSTLNATTNDGSVIWTRVKNVNTVDDIYLAPDDGAVIYRDAHWRQVYFQYIIACLLRKRGETALASRMIAACDRWAKGALDHLSQTSITRPNAGAGRGIISSNSRPAWQANHDYAIGDVCRPSVANDHFYIATTAGTSGGSQPTFPITVGGTVNDNGIIWKEWTVSGSVFSSTYNSASYTPTGSFSIDTNQNGESLSALACLCAEPESEFYDAGAYRTAALAHIEGTVKLLLVFQSGNGAIPLGDGFESTDQTAHGDYWNYSTTYGSYTLVLMATAFDRMKMVDPDWELLPYVEKYIERGQIWMETNFNSDASAYGGNQSEYPGNASNDNANRDYVYKMTERTDPRHDVHWTTGFFSPANDKYGVFSATGNVTGLYASQPGLMVSMGLLFSIEDPTDLELSNVGSTVNLSWVDNADNETHYKVQYKIGNGEWGNEEVLDPNTEEYSVELTEPGTYTFRVCAFSDLAQSNWIVSDPVDITVTATKTHSLTGSIFETKETTHSLSGTIAEIKELSHSLTGNLLATLTKANAFTGTVKTTETKTISITGNIQATEVGSHSLTGSIKVIKEIIHSLIGNILAEDTKAHSLTGMVINYEIKMQYHELSGTVKEVNLTKTHEISGSLKEIKTKAHTLSGDVLEIGVKVVQNTLGGDIKATEYLGSQLTGNVAHRASTQVEITGEVAILAETKQITHILSGTVFATNTKNHSLTGRIRVIEQTKPFSLLTYAFRVKRKTK
jgi:hypothetical protein